MIRRMARRVDSGEAKLGALEREALPRAAIGREPVAFVEADDLCARAILQPHRPGRVVGMGVGDDDPADAIAAACGHGVEVAGVVRTRVDDGDLVDAHQVGVGARARHQPGVGGEDPPHERADRRRHADRQVRHVMSVRPHGEDDAI